MQIRRQPGGDDPALEALLDQHGDPAGVVDVGVGHQDEVDVVRGKGKSVVGHLVPPLLQSAVHQDAPAVDLQTVAAAGDALVGAVKAELHGGTSFFCSSRRGGGWGFFVSLTQRAGGARGGGDSGGFCNHFCLAFPRADRYAGIKGGGRDGRAEDAADPSLLDDWFPLLQYAFTSEEWEPVLLTEDDPHLAELGLKYFHNELCYPVFLVAGQVLSALRSGRYDPARCGCCSARRGTSAGAPAASACCGGCWTGWATAGWRP